MDDEARVALRAWLFIPFRDDDETRPGGAQTMRKRVACKISIDQRDDDADAIEPEPDGDIGGAAFHHQRDGVALAKTLRQSPARIAQ